MNFQGPPSKFRRGSRSFKCNKPPQFLDPDNFKLRCTANRIKMKISLSISFVLVFLLLLSLVSAATSPENDELLSFVVIVDPQSKSYPFSSHSNWYSSLLSSPSSKIHTLYQTLVHGFAATLTPTLAQQIKNSSGVLAVCRDYVLRPHTTRSPSFLNIEPPFSLLSNLSRLGSGSIIGVIDTGIWPESASFDDRDLDRIPEKWSGECEIGD